MVRDIWGKVYTFIRKNKRINSNNNNCPRCRHLSGVPNQYLGVAGGGGRVGTGCWRSCESDEWYRNSWCGRLPANFCDHWNGCNSPKRIDIGIFELFNNKINPSLLISFFRSWGWGVRSCWFRVPDFFWSQVKAGQELNRFGGEFHLPSRLIPSRNW